jgi:PleD family two-component response regulator
MNASKKYSLLLIDDDQFLLDMYAMKFKENDVDVVSSTSGEEALAKLRDGLNPDIIVFDMVMPAMDGFDFLKHVKEEKLAENAVLIALSNQGDNTGMDQAKELGVNDYILKAHTVPSEVVKRVIKVAETARDENEKQ